MLTRCCCSGCVDAFGASGRRCWPTDFDRLPSALDAERTEASEFSPDPTGEISNFQAPFQVSFDVPPTATAADNPKCDAVMRIASSLVCLVNGKPLRDPR